MNLLIKKVLDLKIESKTFFPTKGYVVFRNDYFELICVKQSVEGFVDELIVGAIAGHDIPFSADYQEGKSVLGSAKKYAQGGVWVVNILPPIFSGVLKVTYDTLLSQLKQSIEIIDNGPVRITGICQGGAMAAVFATRYPELVRELVIAAAPIKADTPSSISPAQKFPLAAYKFVVFINGGIMPGKVMAKAWRDADKKHHDEACKKPENAYFYSRYDDPQSIYGIAYYEMIQGWFLSLDFYHSLNVVCPVQTIVGKRDKETPQVQTEAIANKCLLPITKHYAKGGHMSTFGSEHVHEEGGVYHIIYSQQPA